MNVIKMIREWLGIPKMVFLCPWCITSIENVPDKLTVCPNCQSTVPPLYTASLRSAPALFIPVIGWTSTGKTEFIDRLPRYIQSMCRVFNDLSFQYLTPTIFTAADVTDVQTRRGRERLGTDKLDPPWAFVVGSFGKWGDRTLVFRDCKGEFFHNWMVGSELPGAEANKRDQDRMADILRRSPVTVMAFSVHDIRRTLDNAGAPNSTVASSQSGQTDPLMLLNTYLTTVNDPIRRWWHRTNRRSLIVMLTKGDMLRSNAPELVRKYLESDPFTQSAVPSDTWTVDEQALAVTEPWDDARCQQYVNDMDAVSDQIKRWFVNSGPSCHVFVKTCEKNKIDLRFCINSAGELFSTVVDGKPTVMLRPKPYRVVDPVIMALQMTAGHFSETARLRLLLQAWNLLGKS